MISNTRNGETLHWSLEEEKEHSMKDEKKMLMFNMERSDYFSHSPQIYLLKMVNSLSVCLMSSR